MCDFLIRKKFIMHSGTPASFKIECDALTDEEIETFALLISERYVFGAVQGIPKGGLRIADALQKYVTTGPLLIADDVYTTGASMHEASKNLPYLPLGVVLFSRSFIQEDWIKAVFQLWADDPK